MGPCAGEPLLRSDPLRPRYGYAVLPLHPGMSTRCHRGSPHWDLRAGNWLRSVYPGERAEQVIGHRPQMPALGLESFRQPVALVTYLRRMLSI